jgi:hypothetical protein
VVAPALAEDPSGATTASGEQSGIVVGMSRTADKHSTYDTFEKKGGKQPPTPPPAPKSQSAPPKPPASSGNGKRPK